MVYWKEKDSEEVRSVRRIHEGDGDIKVRGLFGSESRLPVKVQLWELDPGVSEGGHVHADDNALEEVYYFFEGSGIMWVDGEDVPIEAGDAIMVPPGADHGFRNTGDGPLKLVIIWGRPTGAYA
jgi:mannose-6-phosphate isomerase-like protein (cupin superfamily)